MTNVSYRQRLQNFFRNILTVFCGYLFQTVEANLQEPCA
ncbi:hypothetical protein APY04_0226 [Hyphomicrobium sulfonivorans]|uniref:Uncharacterized protein n=1 Tax=Hyphomicrobium sulfonivorans TaxID=121290 RepID=A0A109BND5_HYPSL|nr:hypothetical protein APY04_0226 [Hyphomicrobium sulfonivorans]